VARKWTKEPQEEEEEEEEEEERCAVKWNLHYFLLTHLWSTSVILPSVDNADV